MKKHTWRVAVDVPAWVRDRILQIFDPRFPQVHLTSVTWAYGVEPSFPFDSSEQDVVLTGIHRGADHEAFAFVQIGGQVYRPDGQLLFLAFSTAAGVKPAEAGDISAANVEAIEPISFAGRLRLFPNFQRNPTPNPAYSRADA